MVRTAWLWLSAVLLLGCGSSERNGSASSAGAPATAGSTAAGSGGAASAGGTNTGGSTGGAGTGGETSGGGSVSSGGTYSLLPVTGSLRNACLIYMRAACQRREQCTGWEGNCESGDHGCPDYLFSEGSTRTRESVLACAEVYRTQACEEVIANIPPACATDGSLPEGSTCRFSSQCAGSCYTGLSGICGECVPNAELDGACSDQIACQYSQTCSEDVCVDNPLDLQPDKLPGAECEYGCITGYVCARATAGAPRTCLPNPGTGAPCYYEGYDDGVGTQGQCASRFYCDADFKCQPLPEPGQPCAPAVDGELSCRAGSCVDGVCPVVANPGAPCDTNSGVECQDGTRCRELVDDPNSTMGICVNEREEAESCTGAYDQCVRGTVCTGGLCVATDEFALWALCQ